MQYHIIKSASKLYLNLKAIKIQKEADNFFEN